MSQFLSCFLILLFTATCLVSTQSVTINFDDLASGTVILEPVSAYGAVVSIVFNSKPDASKSIFIESDNSTRCGNDGKCNYSYIYPSSSVNTTNIVTRFSTVNKPAVNGNYTTLTDQYASFFSKKFLGGGSCTSFLEIKPLQTAPFPLIVKLAYFSYPTNKTMDKVNETLCQVVPRAASSKSGAEELSGSMATVFMLVLCLVLSVVVY